MPNKFNPFRPDKMAPPGLFHGRIEEIKFIDHCLLQTRDGNPQHFLIEGERGIGKSSLFWLEEFVATGSVETLEKRERLNFLVVSVVLQEQDTYFSVIRKITAAFKAQIGKREKLKSFALSTWDFMSRFEVGGIKYNKGNSKNDDTELLDHL